MAGEFLTRSKEEEMADTHEWFIELPPITGVERKTINGPNGPRELFRFEAKHGFIVVEQIGTGLNRIDETAGTSVDN
jgi:hypothetical protein